MENRIIVADSSCDLNKELANKINVKLVPFNIDVDGENFIDDGTVNLTKFMEKVDNYAKAPTTAAPSPNSFIDSFGDAREIFIVTISSKLSATYNNAILAKNMFLEENDVKIHVFDSKSAVSGETVIALKVREYIEKNLSFEEIVDEVESFIKTMHTFFILDKFDTLIKNGRMSKFSGSIAKILSFKPVMKAEGGVIQVHAKTRGYNKAAATLVESIGETNLNFEEKTLIIGQCEAEDRAKKISIDIKNKYNFKNIEIVKTGMLSSVYANTGGIVVAF